MTPAAGARPAPGDRSRLLGDGRSETGARANQWPRLSLSDFARARQPVLAEPFSSGRTWYFDCGRSALHSAARALGLGPSSRIVAPAYHCGVEVRALLDAGCQVVFHRVERTLEPDLEAAEKLLRQGADALLVVHYFGFAPPMDALSQLASRFGAKLIEDCAHALFGESGARPLGTLGDAAIYSLRKFLPIPDGGVLVLRPGVTAPPAPRRTASGLSELRNLALTYRRGLRVENPLRRARPKRRPEAVENEAVPDDAFRRPYGEAMSRSSRWVWERADWKRIRRVRQHNYVLLHEAVSAIDGARPLTPQRLEGACPWVLPVVVGERDRVVRSLRERGVGAFRVWARWEIDVDRKAFVDVQYLRDHVLALPVHQDLTEDDLHMISRALQETIPDSL